MQILRPDMLPLMTGFIILFLFIIAIVGLLLVYSVLKNRKKEKLIFLTTTKLVLGGLCLGFVGYNWIGYNSIFSENVALIVGKYRSANSTLTINKDYTWQMTGDNISMCRNGKWEFVMSEDWCYWNIESDNMRCRTQIGIPENGAPPTIDFKEQNLIFERKK
jgi:hypothetical protein